MYDPASKRLVHLNPLPEGFAEGFGGDIDFLGPYPPVQSYLLAPSCLPFHKSVCLPTVLSRKVATLSPVELLGLTYEQSLAEHRPVDVKAILPERMCDPNDPDTAASHC